MKRILFSAALLLATICAGRGDTISQIETLIGDGEYAAAASAAREALETDSENTGTLNTLLGEALYLNGEPQAAREALLKGTAKGVADAWRWLGRMAYDDYDLATAAENYGKYFQMKQKANCPTDPAAAEEKERIALAERMLKRVEHIQIIDSLTVPREELLSHYRIPASAGHLLSRDAIPAEVDADDVGRMVFANENDDMRMWARLDSVGDRRLVSSVKLTDGTWHTPVMTDSTLNIGDADYPFMTADGLTLYFAAEGDESIGGLDIFMANRDPSDDSYRIPQNIGMPYNSPFDDYMLAIDETNGVGWWATDRNRLGDEVTLYVFIPNEIRENYPEDTEDIAALARIDDYRATWPEDAAYDELLSTIRSIEPGEGAAKDDFRFPLPDGRLYTRWDDFRSESAKAAMEEYLGAYEEAVATEKELAELRAQYHSRRSQQTASKILSLEKEQEQQTARLRNLRSQTIRLELRGED